MKTFRRIVVALLIIGITPNAFAQFTSITNSPTYNDNTDSWGVAWIDIDNDGDDDLFITTSQPYMGSAGDSFDLMYTNNGDGTFTKVTMGDIVNTEGTGRSSTWADFDNDGFTDVFICNQLVRTLYRNANGSFVKFSAAPTNDVFDFSGDMQGGSWGDYNNDGFVDLFTSTYQINDAARNFLFRNELGTSFTLLPATDNVSAKSTSQGASWIDYNADGWSDLFVPNYCANSFLYTNLGNGTFRSETNTPLVRSSCSVGASWADYDNDGDMDAFVTTNVNSSNALYENNGDGTFTIKSNAATSLLSTSSTWGDFDNDGNIDLVLTTGDEFGKIHVLKNNGDRTLIDVSTEQGVTDTRYGWSIASSDYNNDGFLDLFVAAAYGNNHLTNDLLYRNTPNQNGFLFIKLRGTKTNRSAIGANVRMKTPGKWQMRTVQSKTGNGAQNSLKVHFGMGTAAKADTLIVEWPLHGFQELTAVDKNQTLSLTEPDFPAPASSATAVNFAYRKVRINWLDNSSDETGFRIERAASGGKFRPVGSVGANTTTYVDESVAEGVTYHYRVASKVDGGFSLHSSSVSVLIKKKQTITFNSIGTKFLDSPPFALTATASSGLTPSFVVLEGGDKVALVGSTLTIQQLGISKIGTFQTGDNTWFASDTISQSLNVSLITGIEDIKNVTRVYPNPVRDYLNIQTSSTDVGGNMSLFDIVGRTMLSVSNVRSEERIYVGHLPQGVYTLVLPGGMIRVMKK